MARILVIDDDASLRTFLKKVLGRRGHKVDLAKDGRDALQHLGKKSYDVILVDLLMPVMSGFEFLEALENRTPQIPTIITSGIVVPGVHDYLKTHPQMRILSKPYTQDALLTEIQDLLGRR
jgi:two-component system chemotaxis response regulator CheY